MNFRNMTGYKGLYPNVVAQNKSARFCFIWKRLRQSQRGLLSFSKKAVANSMVWNSHVFLFNFILPYFLMVCVHLAEQILFFFFFVEVVICCISKT